MNFSLLARVLLVIGPSSLLNVWAGAVLAAAGMAVSPLSWALPVAPMVDGRLAGDEFLYGSALSVQNTSTQFGNTTTGNPSVATGGSELDQVFATVSGDRLYVLIAGNLETNFNKLEVFIDSAPGGVNKIEGEALPRGVDPYCCGGFPPPDGFNSSNVGALQRMDGLTFDAGFEADHVLMFSNGFEHLPAADHTFWALTAHYADLTQGVAGNTAALGVQYHALGQEPGFGQGELVDQSNNSDAIIAHELVEPVTPGTNNARGRRDMFNEIDLRMAIDNSNTAGVDATEPFEVPTTANPAAVTTGIEFSVLLSQLGNPDGPIKIAAFINGGGHDYLSNQFAGVGVLSGNLGGNEFGGYTGRLDIDLNNFPGDQFVVVNAVPEPIGLGIAGIAGLAMIAQRGMRPRRS